MPRVLAILLAFLILLAVLLLVFYVLAPLLLTQMGALIGALPGLIQNLERYLIRALEALDRNDLLPGTPENIAVERKSVVEGESVAVRVDLGGRRTMKKKR